MSAASQAFARALPKAELHIHLEGAIRPETLLSLARRHHVELPADDPAGLARWFSFRDFEHFVEIYLTCSRCLRDPEDFQRIALDLLAEQAAQNVLHTEAHFTIATHLANGANGGEVAQALAEAIVEGERRYGVRLRLIPDIVRNVGPRAADRTLDWALDGLRRGSVVALGLSGRESVSNEPFREHFAEAARQGLHRVAHAGEHGGPAAIRSALADCGPERIGHGVRAVEDPELLTELAERRIPLEVCPTSNVALGVVPDLASHPFPRLRAAGIELTVGSDDPPLFATSTSEELGRLAAAFGYGPEVLIELARASFRHAFLEEDERRHLAGEVERRLADLPA